MGESGSQGTNDPLLQSLDDDFQALQRHFADQLAQDIEYLQTEKERLISELEALRVEYDQLYIDYQSLKRESDATLSKRQLAQQNAWAKRLAQVLAQNLREDLHAYVINSTELPTPTQDWLYSLDDTLNRSVKALQHDLSSYQSAIAQQLTRMQAMEQQGEVILENLVTQLSSHLGDPQAPAPPGSTLPNALDNSPLQDGSSVVGSRTYLERPRPDQVPGSTRRVIPPYDGRTVKPALVNSAKPTARNSTLKKGMVLCAIATFGLSAITVLVGGVSFGSNLFGLTFSGLNSFDFFSANTLLWLQLMVLIPVLAVFAPQLYRSVWIDVGQSLRSSPRLFALMGGAVFYFFAQVFLFQAAGTIGPAIAAPLMFAYPLVAVPLLWWLNGDRPNLLRGVVMLAIAMGVVLILLPLSLATTGTALLSAAAFALYVVTNGLSRQSHPISAGIIQYCMMGILSSIVLVIRPSVLSQGLTNQVVWGGLILGLLASASHFFHYTGLRLVGGLRTALTAAATPLVTAILAIALLTNNQPTVQLIQWPGIILITLGGMTLALDRISRQQQAP